MMSCSTGWDLVFHQDWEGGSRLKLRQYRSNRSGLTLIRGDVAGPLVNGYFCLATEAHDDDGLPHTLEHLIFLGSQDWPFKGVLDLIANRCLSSGTNAWTDTDHTCYTMTTAGSEGFLNMLGVYMDHILFPTLTEAGYLTEVHHVNGQGQDAGVVYCEMQGRENTAEERVQRALLQALYPGHCGYKSQTGGRLQNLRDSTSHAKVQAYHRAFYRAENLCLVITGQVSDERVFAALAPIEDKILEKRSQGKAYCRTLNGEWFTEACPPYLSFPLYFMTPEPLAPFLRPWQNPVPAFEADFVQEILYPNDDELDGLVYLGWRGPNGTTHLYVLFATIMMMEYLTDSPISPFQAAFVEADHPLASDVSYHMIENRDCTVFLSFDNVPLGDVHQIQPVTAQTLDQVLDSGVDLHRMKTLIEQRILRELGEREHGPHDLIAQLAISQYLYGTSEQDFKERANALQAYRRLSEETHEFWLDLLSDIHRKPKAVVIGRPSVQLQTDLANEESDRIKQRVNQLGDDGLKALAKEVENAMAENDVDVPVEILDAFPVPSVDPIQFHQLEYWNPLANFSSSFRNQSLPQVGPNDHMIHANTNFVHLLAFLDTEHLHKDVRKYLSLYSELLSESSMEIDGQVLPFEEVIQKMNEDTIYIGCSVGLHGSRFQAGPSSRYVVISVQIEPSKIQKGFDWLHRFLHNVQFTVERVRTVATKMENSVSEFKREGNFIAKTINNLLSMNADSNKVLSSIFQQEGTLKYTRKSLTSGSKTRPQSSVNPKQPKQHPVLDSLEYIQSELPRSMALFIAADFDRVQVPWDLVDKLSKTSSRTNENKSVSLMDGTTSRLPSSIFLISFGSDFQDRQVESRHMIVGIGSVESSYLIQNVASLTDPDHPDYAVLLLYLQYFCQLEGPLWRKLRGQGLSYSYSMDANASKGFLQLALFKTSHPHQAYQATKEIIMGSLSDQFEYNEQEIESAKSSLTFSLLEAEENVQGCIVEQIKRTIRGLADDHQKNLIDRILKANESDLRRVSRLYVTPLLSGNDTRMVIVCHPSKAKSIQAAFQTDGKDFEVFMSVEEVSASLK
ncbi:hypothetical protein TCAL_03614, partial [Tigriopus californicus]